MQRSHGDFLFAAPLPWFMIRWEIVTAEKQHDYKQGKSRGPKKLGQRPPIDLFRHLRFPTRLTRAVVESTNVRGFLSTSSCQIEFLLERMVNSASHRVVVDVGLAHAHKHGIIEGA